MACVLFVDDEPAFLYSLKRMLKLAPPKWKYVTAPNGIEAKKLISQGGIDLVVSDMKMPGIDGLELIKDIKNDPAMKTIPVIILTGKGDEKSVVQAIRLGAADYLVKDSVTQESLERAIIKTLEKPEPPIKKEAYHKSQQPVDESEEKHACVNPVGEKLPYCTTCRMIMSETGKWMKLESFIEKYADTIFTKTVCDDCSTEPSKSG